VGRSANCELGLTADPPCRSQGNDRLAVALKLPRSRSLDQTGCGEARATPRSGAHSGHGRRTHHRRLGRLPPAALRRPNTRECALWSTVRPCSRPRRALRETLPSPEPATHPQVRFGARPKGRAHERVAALAEQKPTRRLKSKVGQRYWTKGRPPLHQAPHPAPESQNGTPPPHRRRRVLPPSRGGGGRRRPGLRRQAPRVGGLLQVPSAPRWSRGRDTL
jgi:hypothetical protein